MNDDAISAIAFLVIAAAVGAHALLRYLRRDRELTVTTVHQMGSAEGMDLALVEGFGGKRYLALEYESRDDEPRDVQVLLTSDQAARLAKLLRIAATPGRTLAVARAVERRRASGRQEDP